MAKMRVAFMVKKGEFEIKDVEIPKVKDDEVLVKVMVVGICGSDVHYFNNGGIGNIKVDFPFILGHECAGIVVDKGEKVKRVEINDRVAVEPGLNCGVCKYCKEGKYNLCEKMEFLATPPIDGSLCQYITLREDQVFVVNDLSYELATLIEPLSVGIHSMNRLKTKPGESLIIFGAGPVGLTTLLAAKYYGVDSITIVDIVQYRLSLAKELGANTINLNSKEGVEEINQLVKEKSFDIGVETSGSDKGMDTILNLLVKGGRLAVIAVPKNLVNSFNVQNLVDRELTIYGIYRYRNTYPLGKKIIQSNIDKFNKLITHHFNLTQSQEAFQLAQDKNCDSIKVMIHPNH